MLGQLEAQQETQSTSTGDHDDSAMKELFAKMVKDLRETNKDSGTRENVSGRRACGGGNGTPLQYSCLENPMDGGAW